MPELYDLLIALGLFALLLIGFEGGFRAGRRAFSESDPKASGQIGAIQGAIIGLLGLLLAFTFAAAGSRFLERQELIVEEANAIGTAYLRADLLGEPHRGDLQAVLREYTAHRIDIGSRVRSVLSSADAEAVDSFHRRMWAASIAGVRARPEMMLGVLPPMNAVIDVHASRLAAGRKHVPLLVMGLLIACSVLSVGVIGYGSGVGGRRRAPLTISLCLLIGAALWITIDLDYARAGLLRLSDAPLKELRLAPGPPR